MSEPDIPKQRGVAVFGRYALALVSVAVALTVTVVMHAEGLVTPLFFLAIIVSAWFGGMRPGLLAALISTLCVDYFFLTPAYTIKFDPAHIPQLLVFFISAVLVSSWSAVRRRAEILLRRARDEQEAKVQERTAVLKQANEKLQAEITERRRVEETLRQRADLLDLTHDTIFARDMRDVITYWNRGAEELYGWSWDEAVGRVCHELTQTIFPAPLEEINETLLRTDRWEGELIHAKRDGSKVVVASRWSLQRGEHGLPFAILETNNDITERRRAEEALRDSEEQWKAAFENNPTMYFMVDAAGMTLSVNAFGAEQLGYTRDELVGRPVLDIFYEADREPVRMHVARCFDQLNQSMNWEARKVRKDGRVIYVRETARAVLLKNRPVILVACEDITERKQAEEELQKTQAELAHIARVTTMGELTSSIAHEVNQPLAAIVTNGNACLRWLSNNPPNVEEARQTVTRMVNDGHRASEVVGRIRAFFRKTAPEKVRVNINQLIEDVIAMVPAELRRNRVRVRTELANDLPRVAGDQIQLQQVLLNLIINAIEAMSTVSGPRELLIKSRRYESGSVFVGVQDSGVGFDEQNAAQLFNAFFTTKPHGLGMGLSISRTTIEAYGGRLWATANDGGGATFQFTLPATDGSV
jgi:PAS domain S-box-containing protein